MSRIFQTRHPQWIGAQTTISMRSELFLRLTKWPLNLIAWRNESLQTWWQAGVLAPFPEEAHNLCMAWSRFQAKRWAVEYKACTPSAWLLIPIRCLSQATRYVCIVFGPSRSSSRRSAQSVTETRLPVLKRLPPQIVRVECPHEMAEKDLSGTPLVKVVSGSAYRLFRASANWCLGVLVISRR